ncbi:kinase-like domain-containing protein [Lentinula aciculospora]|uniref:non-specific serine/threonine protein kinase n=1 Tax=Lentinula aciculospora TaxID=153920 RepID=A0A9W9AW10_9AGAR|nr:kinase-like domain-containing protein [Lentinula aciculospora]
MASSFLDQYEAMDVIGNGAFGIIRKVKRKTDGTIFARKELRFEKMQERDRKQIVAEVNILKELHHDHIVKYHDRYVDKDAGILYIVMEYCGGGDLSVVIQQAQKHNRPIPEDTIWNYFMQLLLALQHCHHPNGHGRNGSGGTCNPGLENEGRERRNQILHRDLKPDNVFLDENNCVKLGDFGLSKALLQTNFANTYVGTPYYMSPEVMQEKAYDSKSDIWSLGCLIYELCAHKPPFHEAKSHTELSILVRNGRIPPLPKGYSQSLAGVIKAMLNLNPAMRPSAAQLLQHERLELVFKVSETEKMLATVKAHKNTILAREREVAAREATLIDREQQLVTIVAEKDTELASLRHAMSQSQHLQYSQQDLEAAVREAISRREEELRVLVLQRESEVATAIAKREEEIIASVNKREEELNEAWVTRVEQIRQEIDDRVRWIQEREVDLAAEEKRLVEIRLHLESQVSKWETKSVKGIHHRVAISSCLDLVSNAARREKTPLEEVKNLLEPLTRLSPPRLENKTPIADDTTPQSQTKFRSASPFPGVATPAARPLGKMINATPASAMKGVVLTSTGEVLATPAPDDLTKLFVNSPKVGLDFTKIFDPDSRKANVDVEESADEAESPPPSPSCRKEKARRYGKAHSVSPSKRPSSSSSSNTSIPLPPTRIRRPSIRSSVSSRPTVPISISSSVSDPSNLTGSPTGLPQPKPLPLPHPHLHNHSNSASSVPFTRTASSGRSMQRTNSAPATTELIGEYDMADEENLPSPFLKRATTRSGSIGKRHSNGNLLRAVAAANATVRRTNTSISALSELGAGVSPVGTVVTRPSILGARKASEETRKTLP